MTLRRYTASRMCSPHHRWSPEGERPLPTVTQSGLEPESCLLVLLTHILQPILNIEKLKPGEWGSGSSPDPGLSWGAGGGGRQGSTGGEGVPSGLRQRQRDEGRAGRLGCATLTHTRAGTQLMWESAGKGGPRNKGARPTSRKEALGCPGPPSTSCCTPTRGCPHCLSH